MQVRAEIVETTYKDVNVRPLDFLTELRKEWNKSVNRPTYQYINAKGVWESWEDTRHGSGDIEYHGEATPEEMLVDKAFNTLETMVREKLKVK